MTSWLLLWAILWNFAAFALMGVDKFLAERHRRRIPEKVLFLTALAGGSVGAMLGMSFFRHKTRHWYFRYGLPALLLVQLALGTWIAIRVF